MIIRLFLKFFDARSHGAKRGSEMAPLAPWIMSIEVAGSARVKVAKINSSRLVTSTSSWGTRAAALALFGLIGFTFEFLGPRAVGFAIDLAGGREDPTAWVWAFLVMALGSVVSAVAMACKPPKSRITWAVRVPEWMLKRKQQVW